MLVEGGPVRALVDCSHDLDLLLVGSRGYGPAGSLLLGRVSGRLIRRAACPVIVVARGVSAPFETLFSAPFARGSVSDLAAAAVRSVSCLVTPSIPVRS